MVDFRNILKLLLIIALVGFVIFKAVQYYSLGPMGRAMISAAKKNCKQSIHFYKKMENCSTYKMDDDGMIYEILGLNSEGGCHVKMGSYNCDFPAKVYPWFAQQNIIYNKKILKGLNHNSLSISSNDKDWQSITNMTQQYCKLESTWRLNKSSY